MAKTPDTGIAYHRSQMADERGFDVPPLRAAEYDMAFTQAATTLGLPLPEPRAFASVEEGVAWAQQYNDVLALAQQIYASQPAFGAGQDVFKSAQLNRHQPRA
ncbi:MAG: hypothetical protein HYS86_03190 [Candidatus Chisholmbacteria bacterium]|nr:hypothetical protein [Candidatus Chisholmbacteria bacterium]